MILRAVGWTYNLRERPIERPRRLVNLDLARHLDEALVLLWSFTRVEGWVHMDKYECPIAIVRLASMETPSPQVGDHATIGGKHYEIVSVGRFSRGDFGPGINCGLEVREIA